MTRASPPACTGIATTAMTRDTLARMTTPRESRASDRPGPGRAASASVVAAAACVLLGGVALLGMQSCTQTPEARAPSKELGKQPIEVKPEPTPEVKPEPKPEPERPLPPT